jgi:hypothetical protein
MTESWEYSIDSGKILPRTLPDIDSEMRRAIESLRRAEEATREGARLSAERVREITQKYTLPMVEGPLRQKLLEVYGNSRYAYIVFEGFPFDWVKMSHPGAGDEKRRVQISAVNESFPTYSDGMRSLEEVLREQGFKVERVEFSEYSGPMTGDWVFRALQVELEAGPLRLVQR